MRLALMQMNSPVGTLKLMAHDQALVAVLWEHESPKQLRHLELSLQPDHPILLAAQQQLQEYFAGQRREFDLPLAFTGTPFQQKVWQALLTIPYGETRSYLQIAQQIGHPQAMRAVGAANGQNPLSIIAPCHRVIGANGKLVGFAGGLDKKHYLLQLENKLGNASGTKL